MKIHVVIVSDQILQNLIPILMDRPDRVVFVITDLMARRRLDQRLANQLRETEIEITRCEHCPDAGFAQIKAFADQMTNTLLSSSADPEIVLNATGGNKLIALGFVEALRGIASRILYTDTAHRRIEYLNSAAGTTESPPPEPTPMHNVLDVPSYLRAQGFQFRRAASDGDDWRTLAAARKAACKFIGKHIANPHLQAFVGKMNALADRALERLPDSHEERLSAPVQSFSYPPRGIWKEAMAELSSVGLLVWDRGSEYFRFRDVAAAHFLRGGWLEEYAFHVTNDEGIYDTRLGVEGAWDNEQAMANEFDVLACHMNQLLFIECKTLNYEKRQNDNEIAYKLDSLGEDVRGMFGSTWLLSAREPTDTLIARARRARIRLVPPSELQELRRLVREWRG